MTTEHATLAEMANYHAAFIHEHAEEIVGAGHEPHVLVVVGWHAPDGKGSAHVQVTGGWRGAARLADLAFSISQWEDEEANGDR